MVEHIYSVRGYGASWGIYIKIWADIEELKGSNRSGSVSAGEKIWIKFAEQPLMKQERFCEEDMPYLVKGLWMVKDEIRTYSRYQETLIVIKSLQFNPCDFQEEGLIAAIMEWASLAFHFQTPVIGILFDRKQNRYFFDFKREWSGCLVITKEELL